MVLIPKTGTGPILFTMLVAAGAYLLWRRVKRLEV